jgi:hypothetical protein
MAVVSNLSLRIYTIGLSDNTATLNQAKSRNGIRGICSTRRIQSEIPLRRLGNNNRNLVWQQKS